MRSLERVFVLIVADQFHLTNVLTTNPLLFYLSSLLRNPPTN